MPRHAKPLTKTRLDKLRREAEAGSKKERWIADATQPGLYALARRGTVKFMFRWRGRGGGRRQAMEIDGFGAITLAQARRIASKYRAQVAEGLDPREVLAARAREGVTVEEGVRAYLADLAERAEKGIGASGKRSGYATARDRLMRNVVPELGDRPLVELTSDDLRRWHRSKASTPTEANRALEALRAALNHCERRGLVPPGTRNVARDVERAREAKVTIRPLTAEEVGRLGEAIRDAEGDGVNPVALLGLRVLLLTGLRPAELVGAEQRARRDARPGLRWGDLVDLESEGVIHLHDSKSGPGDRHIGATAAALLDRPEGAVDTDCVIPGSAPDRPYTGLGKVARQLFKAAGIADNAKGRAVLYSARKTFATIGGSMRGARYFAFVGPLLGHRSPTAAPVTAVYLQPGGDDLRPAADAIAAELARLLGLGEPGEVVEFPTARAAR